MSNKSNYDYEIEDLFDDMQEVKAESTSGRFLMGALGLTGFAITAGSFAKGAFSSATGGGSGPGFLSSRVRYQAATIGAIGSLIFLVDKYGKKQ